jgi:uncharacterized membrane protein YhaH (DUF805 family)
MSLKDKYIKNVQDYSPENIAQAIRDGIVTMYEISKGGNLTPLMRKRIEEALKSSQVTDVANIKTEHATDNSNTENIVLEKPENESNSDLSSETNISIDNPSVPTESNVIDNKGIWNRPFSFKGRITRTEYGISIIIATVFNNIIGVLVEKPNIDQGLAIIALIVLIIVQWFVIAQNTKRCHDRGNSGWYQIIPFYGFVLLFGKGESSTNKYGTDPKAN